MGGNFLAEIPGDIVVIADTFPGNAGNRRRFSTKYRFLFRRYAVIAEIFFSQSINPGVNKACFAR